jgi:hypothetical protein
MKCHVIKDIDNNEKEKNATKDEIFMHSQAP